MSDELKEIIANAATELNPEALDNQEGADNTEELEEYLFEDEEVDSEVEDDGLDDLLDEDDEDEDSDEDETEDSTDSDGEKYSVKVDGQKFEVTLDELKSGYQRQADYTREKQALKADIEKVEAVKQEFSEQFEALTELDTAWNDNPVGVISHFVQSTENPTQAIALLIRDLAADNVLDRQFLDMFGITPDIQNEWRRQSEIDKLQAQNSKVTSSKEKEFEDARLELDIQKAIAEYDSQIDSIIESEGLEFNTKQRAAFRQELASYASENDLTNLNTAYKAFKYEESKTKQKIAKRTIEKAKAKKATNVVSRSGAGEGSPMTDGTDLNALIRQAMKESGN